MEINYLGITSVREACYIRTACKERADLEYFKSLFEREWEYFVIRPDPKTGKPIGETLCCDAAPTVINNETRYQAAACC
ncbi:MAG: hypothetical protein ABIV48_02925 [Pyrinomonadaceae bacterium]